MRFNHVTLIVSDLERSKTFYRTLGLTQIVDAPPRYARFTFPDGDATLSVEVKGEASGSAGGPAELFFQCESVDDDVRALRSGGSCSTRSRRTCSTSGARRAFAIRTATN